MAAVVAVVPADLSRVLVRRFQLAAEAGGNVGLLLRAEGPGSDVYAAATRWRATPAPGGRAVHGWAVRLVHGHGGRVGAAFTLERHRDPDRADDLDGLDVDAVAPAGPTVVRPPAAPAYRPAAGARAIG